MRRLSILVLAAALLLAVVPTPSTAVSFGAMGSKVLGASTDFNPTYSAALVAGATVCSRDVDATGTAGDLYYLNVDGAGTVVAAFDIRLTTAESRPLGLVGSADTDVGQTFNGLACTAFAASLRYLEGDGLPGWTAGDMLAWSPDATLDAGDLRLSTITGSGQDSVSVTAGSVVAVGATDLTAISNNNGLYPDCTGSPPTAAACGSLAVLLDAGLFALRHFDANLNGALDSGDAVYAAYRPAATPATDSPSINDVYLYAGAGAGSFGAKVTRSSADHLVEPQAVCGTPAAMLSGCLVTQPVVGRIFSDLGSASNCDRLVLHFREFDGAAGRVLPGDVILYSPAAGITSCPSPVPSSSVAMGTIVTSASSHFQGTAFEATGAVQIFYVDLGTLGRYDINDPVYLNKPAALGGSDTLAVSAGDLRLTSVTISSTFAAGSVVGASDADISGYSTSPINPDAGNAWFLRLLDNDNADEVALNSMSSLIYHDADADSVWDPVTESVYLDVGSTGNGCGATGTSGCVNSGDFLIYDGSALTGTGASTTAPITCPAFGTDCAALATAFKTGGTDFKVTGTDTTVEASRGETIYFSKDAFVNDEDFALSAATGSSVAAGQVDCTNGSECFNEGLHSSDTLWVSRCPVAGCPGRMRVGDVQIAPTPGTRMTSSGADFVPSLIDLPTAGGRLLRYNRGEAPSVSDDTFYGSTDGTTPTTQDVRLTAFSTQSPGTVLQSTDSEELTATMVNGAALAASIAARDVDGISGYTLNDHVYVNNAGTGMGGTEADTALSAFDLRLTSANTFSAGTIVFAGNSDLTAGTAFTGLGGWLVGFHDDNLNGVVDNTDVVYALPPGTAALSTLPQPSLGAVRLSGSGVSSGGSSGGGGGSGTGNTGTTAPPTTTSASSTTTASSTTASSTSDSSSTTADEPSQPSLASLNRELEESLDVDRQDGQNVLTWDDVDADAYQIFSADSPFVLVDEVPGSQTSYTDEDGGSGTNYLVTACLGACTLSADDVNDGDVPGYTGVPDGEDASKPKGFIPAPSPVLLLGLVLVAALLVRRRLQ